MPDQTKYDLDLVTIKSVSEIIAMLNGFLLAIHFSRQKMCLERRTSDYSSSLESIHYG